MHLIQYKPAMFDEHCRESLDVVASDELSDVISCSHKLSHLLHNEEYSRLLKGKSYWMRDTN